MKMKAHTQLILITAVQISVCCFGVSLILDPEFSQALKIVWGGIIAFNLISIFK